MITNKNYKSIDLFKFIFAILIVLLHINFNNNLMINVIKQYVSRLGVPFFFTTSGFFLSKKLNKNQPAFNVLKGYLKRILLLFAFWSLLYAPYNLYALYTMKGNIAYALISYVQLIIFKSPSYMWYLIALAVATIPFCLMYKKYFRQLFIISIILYIFGTFGNSYKEIFDIKYFDIYLRYFLTTRNGVFFAPLFLCIGGKIQKSEKILLNRKYIFIMLINSYLLFIYEVYFVQSQIQFGQDTSMYFMLPLVIYYLFVLSIRTNLDIKSTFLITFLRKASTGIYCSQFGFIIIYEKFLILIGLYNNSAIYVFF